MININLLPWREKARLEKRIYFGIKLLISLVLTSVLLILVHFVYRNLISIQDSRIAFLNQEITKSTTDLNKLKVEKEKLLLAKERLRFVMQLRMDDQKVILLLNTLAKTIPPSLTLEKVTFENNTTFLEGNAQNESEITQFLKSIAATPGFNLPVLTEISSSPNSANLMKYFKVKADFKDLL